MGNNSLRGRGKKTFRDGSYYAHVIFGKRTVKEGECAAIWTASGQRKLVEGPCRTRLFFSHVRFLDRHVADQNQLLAVQYRDGRCENHRGPVALFSDPCVHNKMEVKEAYKLAANEALVVYREQPQQPPLVEGTTLDAAAGSTAGSNAAVKGTKMAAVGEKGKVVRKVVTGPAVFVPDANEWVHTFSWHGSVQGGKGSKTGSPGDEKVPHALEFQKLRCMPDQMYYSVKDVRTTDDAQITIHLMLFYELREIETMLDATNDPIGDFINAAGADVMTFGANNTYESLLQRSAQLTELDTFPILKSRMQQTGFRLLKVVYRGYSTSGQLQAMHDEAIAKRTKLKLQSDTRQMEQAQQSMELQCRQERSQQEMSVSEAEVRHEMQLLALKAETDLKKKDAMHAQEMRHAEERGKMEQAALRARNDEELRRSAELKKMGVDLTQYMCVSAQAKPDAHVRVESSGPAPALHFDGRMFK